MPFVVVWSIGLTKDSTFTLFLIGYLMMLFNAYRTDGELFARPRNIVLFILCSLALCLTKKTGVYIVIVVSLALAWRFRRKKQVKSEKSPNETANEIPHEIPQKRRMEQHTKRRMSPHAKPRTKRRLRKDLARVPRLCACKRVGDVRPHPIRDISSP